MSADTLSNSCRVKTHVGSSSVHQEWKFIQSIRLLRHWMFSLSELLLCSLIHNKKQNEVGARQVENFGNIKASDQRLLKLE